MRRIHEFAEGLWIFSQYDDKGFGVQAEHDELYVTIDRPLSEEDRKKVEALGWRPQDNSGKFWSKFS